jgi:hypothetical protein
LGQARARQRTHAAQLRAHPWCIYCGGSEPADTIDHMPPRMMFWGKLRPKGLEFPSCKACNNGTGQSDLVASALGRISPGPYTEAQGDEVRRLLASVRNNVPGLLEEMYVRTAGQKLARKRLPVPEGGGVLRADGPLVTKHMRIFAAKMGFAIHFEVVGKPVPHTGGVLPIWFSNAQAVRGEIPPSLLEMLPSPRTLQQGSMEVSDQFQYSWAVTEEKDHVFVYAVFRHSFAAATITATDRSIFLASHSDKFPVLAPGALRQPELWA